MDSGANATKTARCSNSSSGRERDWWIHRLWFVHLDNITTSDSLVLTFKVGATIYRPFLLSCSLALFLFLSHHHQTSTQSISPISLQSTKAIICASSFFPLPPTPQQPTSTQSPINSSLLFSFESFLDECDWEFLDWVCY
ncbi:uncharacterized protein EURHEDRAFT_356492 [Aspergillus ruber CBS 135680]|uniref:Uncharacterized protein n=1 Tax=Aspergillus ruber (strain CBS 135680) TaxID=1388766 RepID=A0A017SI17_ASPRC|nr:uncharacterized protein EURHEDRAFT_356492 [Aspergillus ruber CBS 135680]EYE96592.1 hypothetical protein EURHEDRAFT_356492 [Aspergillus ruber CBS 135680]